MLVDGCESHVRHRAVAFVARARTSRPHGLSHPGAQSLDLVGEVYASSSGGTAKSSLLTGAGSSASESVGLLTRVVLERLAFAATVGLSILTRADARAWRGTGLMTVFDPVTTGWLCTYWLCHGKLSQAVSQRVPCSQGNTYVGEMGDGDIHMALDAGKLDWSGLPKLAAVGDW